MKKHHFAIAFFFLFQTHFLKAQEAVKIDFTVALEKLMNNQTDSLSLAILDDVPAKQFNQEGWEFFNLRENKELQNGRLSMDRFRPIVKEDVIEVREDLVVVLLHERNQRKLRLLSLKLNGDPIESFLLHDLYGYLYEKNFRAYSLQEPYRYDQDRKVFEFYQLIYGYERIPNLENPTQDPIYLQSFHQLKINNQGLFELVLSEDTGDIMFSRKKNIPSIHEVAFHELSILCVSNKSNPENTLWPEEYMTHGDMDSHDSIVIPLAYGAKWDNRFFFIQPRENHQILQVSQRHENIMMFPGDGTSCELRHWKRYQSPWRNLHCEENFFMTSSYNPEDLQRFPAYLPEEILVAFRAACGDENIAPFYHEDIAVPNLEHPRIVPDRIIIEIEYVGPEGAGKKHLIFELANSC